MGNENSKALAEAIDSVEKGNSSKITKNLEKNPKFHKNSLKSGAKYEKMNEIVNREK